MSAGATIAKRATFAATRPGAFVPSIVPLIAASLACLAAAHPAWAEPSGARGPVPAAALPLSLPRDVDRDGVEDASDACPRSGRGVRVDADGCLTFDVAPGAVRFRSGSAWLDPAAERALGRVLGTLERFPRLRFEIRAHADPAADEARALGMALRRAEAVSLWFAERGVGPERSDIVAFVARRSGDADGGRGAGRARTVELRPLR